MEKSIFCNNCGECLDDLPASPTGERMPCPNCGSTSRRFNVELSGSISAQGYVAGIAEREGRTLAFRESTRQGRATSADRNDDSFAYSISGSSPQGEEDTLTACRALVRVLNAFGGDWAEPVIGEGGEDCVALDRTYADRRLSIQVVRAIVDPNLWKQLNRQGSFEDSGIRKDQLVEQIKVAIHKKANDRGIPRSVRSSLTLVLDANRLPVLGFEDVLEAFRIKYADWISSLGFKAVWLVGPLDSLTGRLDSVV